MSDWPTYVVVKNPNLKHTHAVSTPRGFHQSGAFRTPLCGGKVRKWWNTNQPLSCAACRKGLI